MEIPAARTLSYLCPLTSYQFLKQGIVALSLVWTLSACVTTEPEPEPIDPFQSMRDPAAAIERLKAEVKQSPQNASTWYELGQSYVSLNRFSEAVEPLRQASQLAPDRGDYWALLALSLKRSERLEDAGLAYGKALSCSPDSVEYFVSYRELMESLGLEDEFVARVATATKGRSNSRALLFDLLKDYVRAGKGRPAEVAAIAMLSSNPDQNEVRIWLGRALELQSKYEQARQAYQEFVSREPAGVDGIVGLGRCSFELNDLETAKKQYTLARRLAPDRMDATYGLILVALKGDDLAQASNLLRPALEQAPDAVVLQMAQAELYLKQGHADQALTMLKMLQPHAPQDHHLNELMVRAWLEVGQPARAIEILDGPLAREQNDAQWIGLKCYALSEGGYKTRFDAECQGVPPFAGFSSVKDGATEAKRTVKKKGAKK